MNQEQHEQGFKCMVCGKKDPGSGCGRSDCPYGRDTWDEDLGVSPVAMSTGQACCMEEGCEGCQ